MLFKNPSAPALRSLAAAAGFTLTFALGGCSQPSAEDRLAKAKEAYTQGDMFGAELEARKVVEKFPDDPAAVEARLMLAGIFARDQRTEDAIQEAEAVLEKLPLTQPAGMNVYRQYNELLKSRKKFDVALKRLDEFQKKYASEKMLVLNLEVARADIQSASGETTGARATLAKVREVTTDTRSLNVLRQMSIDTFLRDRNTTGAVEFVQGELSKASKQEEKLSLQKELVQLHALAGDYDKLRAALTEASRITDALIADELDRNARLGLAMDMAALYSRVGNYAAAQEITRAALDQATVQEAMNLTQFLVTMYLREGKTSDAVKVFRDLSAKYASFPNGPSATLDKAAQNLELAISQRKIDATPDTSPLTLKFEKDAPLRLASVDVIKAMKANDAATSGAAAPAQADATTSGAGQK